MTQGSTRARVLHWFVRGGVLRLPDGSERPIEVDPIVIGRDEGAGIRVEDPEVSSVHCEVRAINEGILVRDLGSTNGTFVGPLRVKEVIVTTKAELIVGSTKIGIEPQAGKQRVDVGYADRFAELVGSSPKMRRVFGVLEKVAKTPLSILILGETGTGKEVVARSVHLSSPRKDGPFVVVDCGSIPSALAESLLFGHEKGSFTGAMERKKGALAEAHGGTLFLDELGELPIDIQPKLLRVLAERQVKRVGSNTLEPIDVRVLAATRRDLAAEMNAGRFRSDLYFRIAQVRVELPALRERLDDLPMLVEEVCKRVGHANASEVVLDWIERRLGSYDWPGNVRELVNVAQVAATLADTPEAIDDVLTLARHTVEDTDPARPQTAFAEAKKGAISSFERDYFMQLAKGAKGNVSEMARQSGMERHHVRAYLRKYGIEKS